MSQPIQTRGIVLRRIPYSETSVILTVYTEGLGLRKYLVNGVRSRSAKTKSALYQPMSLLDLVIYHREDRDLNRLGEVRAAYVYRSLPFEVLKGAVGLFMVEVAQKTIREGEANPELFEFLYGSFTLLDQWEGPVGIFPIWYLVRLSTYLGIRPGGQYSPNTPVFDAREGVFVADTPGHAYFMPEEEAQALGFFVANGLAESLAHSIPPALRRSLLQHLLGYYRLQLEYMSEVHAHLVLQEVL